MRRCNKKSTGRLPIPPCCVVRRRLVACLFRHALLRVAAFLLSRLPCFHYGALCFVVVRRSLGRALNVRSLLRVCHALPTEKYAALNALDTSFRRQAAGCVQLRRTHILTGFARIIPDTRPSGSLRSRKIAPGDFFRFALLLIIPAFGGYDKQERRE